MSEDTRYNGWTNYETWLIKLWMDNEQGSNEYWEEMATECMTYAIDNESDAETVKDAARNSLAERIHDEHEYYVDEIGLTGFMADLMNSSLSRVDWREIAEHYVDEIPVYCAGWNMPGYMPESDPAMFIDFDDAVSYVKEVIENHLEDDETVTEEQAQEILDGIDGWKESGKDWGFTFGQYYWIVQN